MSKRREFLLGLEVFYFLRNQKQKMNIKAIKKLLTEKSTLVGQLYIDGGNFQWIT